MPQYPDTGDGITPLPLGYLYAHTVLLDRLATPLRQPEYT
jgi:hypothetical protein